MSLSVSQAAELRHVPQHVIRSWCSSGLLRASRVGGDWSIDDAALSAFTCPRRGRPTYRKIPSPDTILSHIRSYRDEGVGEGHVVRYFSRHIHPSSVSGIIRSLIASGSVVALPPRPCSVWTQLVASECLDAYLNSDDRQDDLHLAQSLNLPVNTA